MPKVNVYLPQWLADAVRDADLAVSEVCQRALTEAVGRTSVSRPYHVVPPQPPEERAKDLERGAAAVRYGLAPTKTVPAMIKPIGAALALSALRAEDPTLLQWEHKAQDVAGWAAAIEVAHELHATAQVVELLEQKLAAAQEALAAVEVSKRFGATEDVLDLVAELQERAHPREPR